MPTRRGVLTASAAGLAFAASAVVPRAFAQSARKLVRIVVGLPAGGITDLFARFLAERLQLPYASTVIVENRPGASTRLAVEHVKNAEPDGSVLLLTPEGAIVLFPHSFRKLNYDPLRDLTPVAPTMKSMLAFMIGPTVPQSVRSLSDFMKWCKANPNDATLATVMGGPGHFVGYILASAARVPLTLVPYKGGVTQQQDVLGGHVAGCFNFISDVLPLANSATVRLLVVTGSQRSRFLPDIPTLRELGYDFEWEPWIGIFAPARVPPDTLRILSAAVGEVVNSPWMAEQLAKVGADPMFQSPEQFAATVKADIERWGPVVKASGFVAD